MTAKIIFNDKLISEVRKRPCLWMITDDWRTSEEPDIRHDVARKKAWWEIAQLLYTPEWEKQTPEAREAAIRTIQKRFGSMKKYYEGYKRGPQNWSTYPEYFAKLSFLDGHELKDRPPTPANPPHQTQSKTEKANSDETAQQSTAMGFPRPNPFLADGVGCKPSVMIKTEFDDIANPAHGTVEQSTEEFYRPYPPSECQSVMTRAQHDNYVKVSSVFSVENGIQDPLTEVELSRSTEEFYLPSPHFTDKVSCRPVMIKTELDNISNTAHGTVEQLPEEFYRPDPPSGCQSVMTRTQNDDHVKVRSVFSVENGILKPLRGAKLCGPKSSEPDLVVSVVKPAKTQKDHHMTESKSVASRETQTTTETFNPNRSFLLSLLPDLESLSPNMQLEFKMQIYNVIKTIKYPAQSY